jgi:hypothetical protein
MPDSRSSSVAIAQGAPCLFVRGPTAVRMPAMVTFAPSSTPPTLISAMGVSACEVSTCSTPCSGWSDT